MELSQLDGARLAIELGLQGIPRVLLGSAMFEYDPNLGNVLRVSLDAESAGPGNPEFLIREKYWDGAVDPDGTYGCDYRLQLAPGGTPVNA
jgi:hypothetical protein